jgi:hypothetical protein
MPRAPIYPEVEQFIALKKLTKLETVQSSNITETSTAQNSTRRTGNKKYFMYF